MEYDANSNGNAIDPVAWENKKNCKFYGIVELH